MGGHKDIYLKPSLSDRQSPQAASLPTFNKLLQHNVRNCHVANDARFSAWSKLPFYFGVIVPLSPLKPYSSRDSAFLGTVLIMSWHTLALSVVNRQCQLLCLLDTMNRSCRIHDTIHNAYGRFRCSDRQYRSLHPAHTPKSRNIPCGSETILSGNLGPIDMELWSDRQGSDDPTQSLR
jgi:hypothetical protein